DQLLIHLVGKKAFSIRRKRDVNHPRISFSPQGPPPPHFGAVYQDGFSDEGSIHPSEIETVTLLPGTCLFLPAGTWHRTEGQTEPCLSLVAAVRAPSAVELIGQALTALLMQSEDCRAPAYGLFSDPPDPTEFARIERVLSKLPSHLDALDPGALRRAFYAAQSRKAPPTPSSLDFTRFIRVPSTKMTVKKSEQDAETLSITVRSFLSATPSELQM